MHSSDARKCKQLARSLKTDSDTVALEVSAILSTVLGPNVPLESVMNRLTEIGNRIAHMQTLMYEQIPAIGEEETTHE